MPLPPDRPARHAAIRHLVCLVFFVIIPILVTAMLPVTWISLARDAAGRVSATSRSCVLFVIPWRSQRVGSVIGVEAKTIRHDQSVTRWSRGYSRPDKKPIHSDGVDELVVNGRESNLTAPISPASSAAATAKVQAFLDEPSQSEMRLFVIANWKFGLSFGIPLTLLAALCIGSYLAAILRRIFRWLRPAEPGRTSFLRSN